MFREIIIDGKATWRAEESDSAEQSETGGEE